MYTGQCIGRMDQFLRKYVRDYDRCKFEGDEVWQWGELLAKVTWEHGDLPVFEFVKPNMDQDNQKRYMLEALISGWDFPRYQQTPCDIPQIVTDPQSGLLNHYGDKDKVFLGQIETRFPFYPAKNTVECWLSKSRLKIIAVDHHGEMREISLFGRYNLPPEEEAINRARQYLFAAAYVAG